MDDNEKRAYLRNVAAIANADHVVVAAERTWARHLCETLEFDATEWKALLAEGGRDIDLRPLKRLSTQVRCLEDMVEISLTDGSMADSEKQLLFSAARDAGITSQQVMRILDEAAHRLRVRHND